VSANKLIDTGAVDGNGSVKVEGGTYQLNIVADESNTDNITISGGTFQDKDQQPLDISDYLSGDTEDVILAQDKNGNVTTGYTVTFESDGGSAVASQVVASGDTFSAPDQPTRSGYRFAGWYHGDTAWNFGTNTVVEDLTLTAHWDRIRSSTSTTTSTTNTSTNTDQTASVEGSEGGSVTADKSGTVTITPDQGYEIASVTVNGQEVEVPDDGILTDLTAEDEVEVTFQEVEDEPAPTFTDVSNETYYTDAVSWAVKKGITNGTSGTSFSPNSGCTRAQVVTFLWRAAGEPAATGSASFGDVSADAYYAAAVAWAVEQGITNGTGDDAFSPNATCTRGQIVTFLARYAQGKASTGDTGFADVTSGSYYAEAVAWAVENGVTNGTTSTTFAPDDTCTRGQVVTFLYRAVAE
jgi:uncharacterized repeat protein (TIGR02543 family)